MNSEQHEKILALADSLESGYVFQRTMIEDIAQAVGILLRIELEKGKS